jgi:bacterioferritin
MRWCDPGNPPDQVVLGMMADEEGHIDFLETQIDLYDRIGEAEYGTLNALPTDEAGED